MRFRDDRRSCITWLAVCWPLVDPDLLTASGNRRLYLPTHARRHRVSQGGLRAGIAKGVACWSREPRLPAPSAALRLLTLSAWPRADPPAPRAEPGLPPR